MPAVSDGHPLSPTQASAVALRTAVVPSVVVGLVAVALAWWLKGTNGALGAALGSLVAILFFAVGQYVLGRILDGNPDLALSAGLLLYLTQVLVLFGLIVVLRDATWLDGRVFGMAVLAVTLTWIVASIISAQRVKMLYVDPSRTADPDVPAPSAGEAQ